ncbi:tripartite tricarboxylate transporter substrate binding protein [Desulfovibrio sp. OttesenSCG-928-C06]|nr:tripartite tricarboxylate transporter substrate binding protein [Desulfovibrio sp. OttesenSCG-928-C06]
MRQLLVAIVSIVFLSTAGVATQAKAADYPDRPVKMLVSVGPGAFIDLLARAVANNMSNDLGQPMLVTNTPGGSHGSVMVMNLKNAKNDGYTLGVSATAAYTYSPHFAGTRYTLDEFIYISLLGLNQSGVVCAPDKPWNSLREAIDWAKKENKGLSYVFQGADDRQVMERIARLEGVDISFLPSTGGPSVLTAVMGGHADLGHTGAILFEYVKANRVKCLAATTPERLTALPDIPTLREQGWQESVEMFVVLAAPRGTPEDVLGKIEQSVLKLKDNAEFQDMLLNKLNMRPTPLGREYAAEYMKSADANFARLAREAGVKK